MRPGLYRGIQNVGTGDMLELTKLRFAARPGSDVKDSMPWCVLAREERGSGRRTIRRTGIGVGKDHPLPCQLIEMGRFVEVGTHITGIAPTEIIEVDEEYIWWFVGTNNEWPQQHDAPGPTQDF